MDWLPQDAASDEARGAGTPSLPLTPHSLAGGDQPPADLPRTPQEAQRRIEKLTSELAVVRAALESCQHELALHERLGGFSARLASFLDRDAIVHTFLEELIAVVEADQGSVMLLDPNEQSLWIAAAVGLPEDVVRSTVVRVGEGVAGFVAQTGQGTVINDNGSGAHGTRARRDIRSALSIPLRLPDGTLFGVVNLGSTKEHRFDDSDVARLAPFSALAASALVAAQEHQETRRLFLEALHALVVAIETKDPYARGHTEHVIRYAVLLARKLGLSDAEVQTIELAALLHDIGMQSAGEALVVEGRPLSALEQTLIRMHPKVATQFLADAPSLGAVVPIIFHHHERYDGSGYLEGLKGGEIPLGARILAVADAFAAMTTDRPYRKARSMDEALEELKAGSGTQFDPTLVEVFLAVAEETPEIFRHKG